MKHVAIQCGINIIDLVSTILENIKQKKREKPITKKFFSLINFDLFPERERYSENGRFICDKENIGSYVVFT